MPSSLAPTSSLREGNLVSVPKANKTQFISSFVKEQKSYAMVHAYQGRTEISSWQADNTTQTNGRPPPSTIIGFNTPVLKARRSKKENEPNPGLLNPVSSQHVKASSQPTSANALGATKLTRKHKKKRANSSSSSCGGDEEAAQGLRQRRKRKRARREIVRKPEEEESDGPDEEHGDESNKSRREGKKPKIPAGYALMHGFKAENVGKSRLTIIPQLGVFNRGKASLRASVEGPKRKRKRPQTQTFEERLLEQTTNPRDKMENSSKRTKSKQPKQTQLVQYDSTPSSKEEAEESTLAQSADWDIPSSEFRIAAARLAKTSNDSQSELVSPLSAAQHPIDKISTSRTPIVHTDRSGWNCDEISSLGPWQSASQCIVESPKQLSNSQDLKASKYFAVPDSELMAFCAAGIPNVKPATLIPESHEPLKPVQPALHNGSQPDNTFAVCQNCQDDKHMPHCSGRSTANSVASSLNRTARLGLNQSSTAEGSQLSSLNGFSLEVPPGSMSELGSLLSLYQEFGLAPSGFEEECINDYTVTDDYVYEEAEPSLSYRHQTSLVHFDSTVEYSDHPMSDPEFTHLPSLPRLESICEHQDMCQQADDDNEDYANINVYEEPECYRTSWDMPVIEEAYEEGWDSPVNVPSWLHQSGSGRYLTRLTQVEQEVANTLKDHWLPQKL